MFRGVETLLGDRATGDLASLRGRTWDAVIDNSATTNPAWVRASTQLLRDAAEQYLFISSRAAYVDYRRVPMTANAPTHPDVTPAEPRGPVAYGPAKAMSEREVHAAFPGHGTIVRPGLIVGPDDETDRFTYWVARIARGGQVLAPGTGDDPVQIIDVRDLNEWVIRLVEQQTYGTFNGLGPQWRTFGELLYGIRAVTTAETRFTWADADFLGRNDIRGYDEMPAWRPQRDGFEGFARFDITPEIKSGLTFRPLAVTARDTLDYHESRPADRPFRAGMTSEREVELLRAWEQYRSR
jgi:2'-hydroxyisoflavone reductase